MNDQSKPDSGKIELDNQRLLAVIGAPDGHIRVWDKVAGVHWTMPEGPCGGLTLAMDGGQRILPLGQADGGVAFTSNYYAKRAHGGDNYHDVLLSGGIADIPGSRAAVRFLLSDSFPLLFCFFYATGPAAEHVKRISFPKGFDLEDAPGSHIYLPESLKAFEEGGGTAPPEALLGEPDPGMDHIVAGAPFFAAVRETPNGRGAACVGHPIDPRCLLAIRRAGTARRVTPRLDTPGPQGKTAASPHRFVYRFEPTNDPRALAWLAGDYIQSGGMGHFSFEGEPL